MRRTKKRNWQPRHQARRATAARAAGNSVTPYTAVTELYRDADLVADISDEVLAVVERDIEYVALKDAEAKRGPAAQRAALAADIDEFLAAGNRVTRLSPEKFAVDRSVDCDADLIADDRLADDRLERMLGIDYLLPRRSRQIKSAVERRDAEINRRWEAAVRQLPDRVSNDECMRIREEIRMQVELAQVT